MRVVELREAAVVLADEQDERPVDADVVLVIERAAPSTLVESLRAAVNDLHVVGDSNGPRYLQDGLLEAAQVAAAI